MRAIIWLDEDDLVLVFIIQRSSLIHLDREMESRDPSLHPLVQRIAITSVLCNKFCAPEAILRRVGTRDKNGAIVNGH